MWDLTLMSIFVNQSLYVSYSSLLNMGPECYKLLPLNFWRPRQGHVMRYSSTTRPGITK
jgi:hypothetical protein